MAQQIIDTGNTGKFVPTADRLFVAFTKCNHNFTELYNGIFGYVTTSVLDSYFANPSSNPSFDAVEWANDLGLGDMAFQLSSNVLITGGTITGITDLAIADGGTGASTAAQARINLGLEIGVDVLAPNGDGSSLTGITASQIENIPSGSISSNDVQSAINELSVEKQPINSNLTSIGNLPYSFIGVPGLYEVPAKAIGIGWVIMEVSNFAHTTLLLSVDEADTRNKIQISALNTPSIASGSISATNVQDAINELDTEKMASGFGQKSAISTQNAAYNVTINDYTILADASGAGFTITLPAAASATQSIFNIKKIDNSGNLVTISGATIDGSASQILSIQWQSITVQSDGTSYFII